MRVSPLQKYEPKDWAGLTTENHLGAMFGTEPHLMSNLIENIFDTNLGSDLEKFMDQFPAVEVPDEDADYEWFLQGQTQKNLPLIGAYNSLILDALPIKPGVGVSRFVLEFSEKLWSATDVLVGEIDTEYLFMQVKTDPTPNGTNWLYEVELVTGDTQLFVPQSHLAAGLRFSKDYSATENTLSKRGGGVSHSSPFRMSNRCSMIRKNYEVPGNMITKGENKPLAFSFKDENGKIHTTWLSKLDWDFMSEFRMEKARLLMYAQPNKTAQGTYLNKGESGYEIKMGAGLLAQVAPSNIFHYTKFSVKLLMDVLMSLSYGKLPEDKRKFVLGTGEYGWIQFHEEVERLGVNFSANNAGNRITGSGNNLRFGGQYTSVGLLQGIEVTLMKIPHFDDIIREKAIHPDGGTLRSREYLIMDFGTTAGKPNIQRLKVKGAEEAYRYIPGMRDPFSPYNNLTKPGMAASKVDGYEVFKAYWGGIIVNNPMRMARLIPAFQ